MLTRAAPIVRALRALAAVLALGHVAPALPDDSASDLAAWCVGPAAEADDPDELIAAERAIALAPADLQAVATADGRVFRPGDGGAWIARIAAPERFCVVWRRGGPGGDGLRLWDGDAWRPLPRSRVDLRFDHVPLFRELRWVGDGISGDLWLRVEPGFATDLLEVRPAGPDDESSESLVEHGEPHDGLVLGAYTIETRGGTAIGMVVENRRATTMVAPFRSARLLLVGRCGVHEMEHELPLDQAVDLRPGGLFADDPIHAFGRLLPGDQVGAVPPVTGDWEFWLRIERAAHGGARSPPAWSGRVESNRLAVRVDGWIRAVDAARAAAPADRVALPMVPGPSGPRPDAGEYRSGDWRYVVEAGSVGSRSETLIANLWLRDRLVVPAATGDTVDSPFGELEYRGWPPRPAGLAGYRPASGRATVAGWFPRSRR